MKQLNDQKRILVQNESKVLEGHKKMNTLILAGILLLSFIGLGHSVGGLKELRKRMNNPFTNWVHLPISTSDYKTSEDLQKFFAPKNVRDSFLIDTIRGYKRDAYRFISHDGNIMQYKRSRTIDPEEQLLIEILKPSNVILSKIKENLTDEFGQCWIIVKKESLEQLQDSIDISQMTHLHLSLTWSGENTFSLYLPIVSVVNDLPDHADFVISEHLDGLLDKSIEETNFININTTSDWSFLSEEQYGIDDLQPLFTDSLKIADIDVETITMNGADLNVHKVYMEQPVSLEVKFNLQKKLSSKYPIKPYHDFECNIGEQLEVEKAQYLAISFTDLQHVRKFRDFIKYQFGFDISLNQVEDKENFSLVATLTLLLAFILFLISMTGVIIFIVNLLIAHFDKIQNNLGTFKAFGLSNEKLLSDYTYITLLFFGRSLGFAILGVSIYAAIMFVIKGSFNLLHWSFPVVVVVILGIVYLVIQRIIKNKLSKTPGDLIYNR